MAEGKRTRPEIGAQWPAYTNSLHLQQQHAGKHSGSKAEQVECINWNATMEPPIGYNLRTIPLLMSILKMYLLSDVDKHF